MTQIAIPEGPSHGDVRSALNLNVTDAETRISTLEIATIINDPALDLGAPVGGYYQITTPGRYIINDSVTWTNAIEVVVSSATDTFTIEGNNLNTIVYNGANSLIKKSGVSGGIIIIKDLQIQSTVGDVFEINDVNTVIFDRVIPFSSADVGTISNASFLTGDRGFAQVANGTGLKITSVDIVTMFRPQWSSGADTGGVGFTLSGTGSRAEFISLEGETATSEYFIDIDAAYGGEAILTGLYTNAIGAFFDPTGLDYTDLQVFSTVKGVGLSRSIGSFTAQTNTAETTVSLTPGTFVDCNFDGKATLLTNNQRFTLTNSTTGEMRLDSTSFNGSFFCPISAVGSGGASLYKFRVTVNGVAVQDSLGEDITTANEISGTMSSTALLVPLDLVEGDLVKLQVANFDNTSNITINPTTISIQ